MNCFCCCKNTLFRQKTILILYTPYWYSTTEVMLLSTPTRESICTSSSCKRTWIVPWIFHSPDFLTRSQSEVAIMMLHCLSKSFEPLLNRLWSLIWLIFCVERQTKWNILSNLCILLRKPRIFSWVLCNICSTKLDYPWNYGFFLDEKAVFTKQKYKKHCLLQQHAAVAWPITQQCYVCCSF